jgi:hypothetical protein
MVRSPPPIVSKCVRGPSGVPVVLISLVFIVFVDIVVCFGSTELNVFVGVFAIFFVMKQLPFPRVSIRPRLVVLQRVLVAGILVVVDVILRRALRPKRVAPVWSNQVRAADGGSARGASTTG